MTRVGFVGAGRVGGPMVRRLVESGHDVRALGRSDEKRRAVQELGAHAVTDLTAVADGADVVVVCVFTDEQVQVVCSDLVGAMPRGPRSSFTRREAREPPKPSPPKHRASTSSMLLSAAARTTSLRAR
jgi:nucleoside-diphosphate-sugar epimerase